MAQEAYMKLELALNLFNEGQLALEGTNGTEIPITLESTGCASDDQLLNWILNNPDKVVLKGTGDQTRLTSLLNAVGNQTSPNPGT
jgi:hypothetical protein